MGEWSRARDAIHDAETREARDAAMDELWRLAQEAYVERLGYEIEGVRAAITNPSPTDMLLLDWVRDVIGRLATESDA